MSSTCFSARPDRGAGRPILRCWSICATIVAICMAATGLARADVPYNITALNVLPGSIDGLAFGLNNVGQVVGDSRLDRTGNVGRSRPVVWDYGGAPHELWSDQTVGGNLLGINNSGEIVGRYGSGSGIPLPGPGVPYGRAFYFSTATGRIDIGLAPTGNSKAAAINAAGQVAGTSETLDTVIINGTPMQQYIPHAFVWDKTNGIRAIGDLNGGDSFANAVNSYGQVVGYGDLANGHWGAFVWDATNGIRDLPTTPGQSSQAYAINDRGQVLGVDFGIGGVLWDLATGTETAVPNGDALNNLGQVVGSAYGGGAFLWYETGGTRLLSSLIPAGTGWQLDYAFAINDAGDIAGYGLLNGQIRGFLMTPVPEPASWLLFASAAAALISLRCLGRPFQIKRRPPQRRPIILTVTQGLKQSLTA